MPTQDMPDRGWATHSNRIYIFREEKVCQNSAAKVLPEMQTMAGQIRRGKFCHQQFGFPRYAGQKYICTF